MCQLTASRRKLLEFTKYEGNWVNQPRLQKTITENDYSTSLLDSDWRLLIATALKAKCKAFLKLSISIQTSSMWTMRHFCVVLGLQHEKQKKKRVGKETSRYRCSCNSRHTTVEIAEITHTPQQRNFKIQ